MTTSYRPELSAHRYWAIIEILRDHQAGVTPDTIALDPRWSYERTTLMNDLRPLAKIGLIERTYHAPPGRRKRRSPPWVRAVTIHLTEEGRRASRESLVTALTCQKVTR